MTTDSNLNKDLNKEVERITGNSLFIHNLFSPKIIINKNNYHPAGASNKINLSGDFVIFLNAPRVVGNFDLGSEKRQFSLSLKHEFNHTKIPSIVKNPQPKDTPLIKNFILTYENSKLLSMPENYFSSPIEINVEHDAIKDGYEFFVLKNGTPLEVFNKTIKDRIEYSFSRKSSFFIPNINLNSNSLSLDVIFGMQNLLTNQPDHIFYRESSIPAIGFKDDGRLYFPNDCIVQYINDRKFEGFNQFCVDLGEYKIPYDLCVAITLEFSKSPDIQKIKDLMKNPEYPLQLKDFELNKQLEKYNESELMSPSS